MCRRFIPTPVGNASSEFPTTSPEAVHPHARGERNFFLHESSPNHGSSPRPWGTPERGLWGMVRGRFIPTPVGNARITELEESVLSVHPHARGERIFPWCGGDHDGGSSPRPWGTLFFSLQKLHRSRFIPTPVGNAFPNVLARSERSVHPHARGERKYIFREHLLLGGSSPRPWGTRQNRHPAPIDYGSSPRPWGTQGMTVASAWRSRFIPTPVGNASLADSSPWVESVPPPR